MSELNVLALAFLLKYISVCVIALIAGYLAYHAKEGWGWMIFLALLVSQGSYKYNNDSEKTDSKETQSWQNKS
jgi:hypothetical protein